MNDLCLEANAKGPLLLDNHKLFENDRAKTNTTEEL